MSFDDSDKFVKKRVFSLRLIMPKLENSKKIRSDRMFNKLNATH